ncbi:MAG: UbiD family decarboxylase [Candidatus Binatia bacterium]
MNLAQRKLTDLQAYIDYLHEAGQLLRVHSPVDPIHELAGFAKAHEGGKVVLFEKVKRAPCPVLMGLYWNRQILADLFETSYEALPFKLADEIAAWKKRPMPPVVVPRGPANEVVESAPDLGRLPIPRHWLKDGGRYLTSSVVIARHPDTGVRNASIHRFMVKAGDRMALDLEEKGHLRAYFRIAEARRRPLEITINNGVDPSVHFAAATPGSVAPIDVDELGIASQLLGEPLRLVRSQCVGVEGIATAQFVIEAEIVPRVRSAEGPYGEITGYYAQRKPRWLARVKCITRRRRPVLHNILPGLEVYHAFALSAEAGMTAVVKRQVPGVRTVTLSLGSVPYHAVVQMRKTSNTAPRRAIRAAFDSLVFLKMVTVVDEDVNPFDPRDVEWAVATRCRPERDISLFRDVPGHRLNPSVIRGKWTRIGYDATVPLPRAKAFERSRMAAVDPTRFRTSG